MEIQWPLVLFTLLVAWGGMTFAFVGVSEFLGIGEKVRKRATALSLALMFVGGLSSVLHLGQPANIMAAAANLFSFSAISVEMISLGFALIVAIAYLVSLRGGNAAACKAVGAVGVLAGVLLSFVTGSGYMMDAQPVWNTVALPLGYLGSGLAMGSLTFATLMALDECPEQEMARMRGILIGCGAVCAGAFLLYAAMAGVALDPIFFWVGSVVVGGVGSVLCAAVWAKKGGSVLYLGATCAVVGALCFRVTMWLAGTGFLDLFAVAAAHGVLGL